MNLRTRIPDDPIIDMTSLIDVVFLLLLFFMVSTTFQTQAALKIELPDASAKGELATDDLRLDLTIDAEGRMYLNDNRVVDDRPQTLVAAFLEVAGDDRTIPLTLRADRQTPHHFVVMAMDVAAQLGFTNLSIATDRSDRQTE